MTAIEFRLFFESLPDKFEVGHKLPTKRAFIKETGLQFNSVKSMASGTKPINDYTINKLLPIMRRYGFQG